MKNTLYLLLTLAGFVMLKAEPIHITTTAQTKQNTIFWFDLDDVVTKKRIKASSCLKIAGPFFKALIQAPFQLKTLKKIKGKNTTQLLKLADQNGYTGLKESILATQNELKEPVAEMAQTIKDLHDKGYILRTATNMPRESFDHLKKKPNHAFLACFGSIEELEKSAFPFEKDGKFVKKPNIQFFHKLLQEANNNPDITRIIYIDDLAENLDAAKRAFAEFPDKKDGLTLDVFLGNTKNPAVAAKSFKKYLDSTLK